MNQDCKKMLGAAGAVAGGILGTLYISEKLKEKFSKHDAEDFGKEGYSRRGYGSKSYSCNEFHSDGFNGEESGWQGYFPNGYNQAGVDRSECDRQYYAGVIKKLRFRLDESYQQLQQGNFRYAVYDAGTVLEEILRLIVQHANGTTESDDSILGHMKICERKGLLGCSRDFMTRLHEVRYICDFNGRGFAAEEKMNHGKAHFVIMQIKDLLNIAEELLVCE